MNPGLSNYEAAVNSLDRDVQEYSVVELGFLY
jgi:hypothetical protein